MASDFKNPKDTKASAFLLHAPFLRKLPKDVLHPDEVVNQGKRKRCSTNGESTQEKGQGKPRNTAMQQSKKGISLDGDRTVGSERRF